MITSAVKRILWEVAKFREQKSNEGSSSRDGGSYFRLSPAAPLHCPIVLPLAPSLLSPAPLLLLLKQLCSLSRLKTAIINPKFGVYIIYIYSNPIKQLLRIHACMHAGWVVR